MQCKYSNRPKQIGTHHKKTIRSLPAEYLSKLLVSYAGSMQSGPGAKDCILILSFHFSSIHICFHFSPKLPDVILRGSPSLLWMASNSGDGQMFEHLLNCLDGSVSIGMPSAAPGGTTVIEMALSKSHGSILDLALGYPSLFPR